MTLRPSDDFGVEGYPGDAYDVNPVCAAPDCQNASVHAHHLYRRSFLKKNYEWVKLSDGTIHGNRIGLCRSCHENVTGEIGGYRARIVFSGGTFWWEEREDENAGAFGIAGIPLGGEWRRVGPLDPQPPASGQRIAQRSENGEVCPSCGKPKTRRTTVPGPARKTKTWALTVPDDAEQGAEILDGWADDFAVLLGFGDASSRLRRYHAVVTVLAWATQNRDDFVRDLVASR